MFPQEIHSPLVAHIGLVNNTVLLAAAQLWQSTKSRSAKMDFIVEIPPCRPESDSFTSIRGRQLSEMCTRRKKQFALRWEPCGVSSARLTPLCASEKTNLLHRGRWKNAWLAPITKRERSIRSQRPHTNNSLN